ncbi:MAG: hypothetical protein Q9219_005069 [cf. Caloplaca sp. 3 TL-2023]
MASSQVPIRIGLFCGAGPGVSPAHLAAARSLAQAMHAHSIHLVYGGGTTGLMGEVARTLVKLSGKDAVIGVIPSSLMGTERPGAPSTEKDAKKIPKNWARRMGITGKAGKATTAEGEKAKLLWNQEYGHVEIVPDLQARKKKMMELVREGGPGSGFVALSGGIGTLDELVELMSWNKMGVHKRGICVFNVNGFWDGLLGWVDKAFQEGFIREQRSQLLGSVTAAEEVIGWLRGYEEGRARENGKK